MRIGVIGNGFVGGAVAAFFREHYPVAVHDKDPSRSGASFQEALDTDVVFLCVPTPTENGCQDSGHVQGVVGSIAASGKRPVVAIKSTALPGTTEELVRKHPGSRLVFNPEFLTARTAAEDFRNPTDIIIGEASGLREEADIVGRLYGEHFPRTPTVRCSASEAEMIKYARNTFYAAKVAFFNEIYLLCCMLHIDYDEVRRGVVSGQWVSPMHTLVPGPDGRLGFGGACLPKDSAALVAFGRNRGADMRVLAAALEANRKIRGSEDPSAG